MNGFLRYLAAGCVLIAGLASLSFLQKKFDDGDARKALAVIQEKSPESQDCVATMTSRWRGVVHVTCRDSQWEVDVLRGVFQKIKN